MLPDIKISLPIIMIAWCLAAGYAFEGLVMLAYPAMWLAIALVFFAFDRFQKASRPAATGGSGAGDISSGSSDREG